MVPDATPKKDLKIRARAFTFPRKIYFQRDVFYNLGEILINEGINNALLITDKNLEKIYSERIESLKKSIDVIIYSDVNPEPSFSDVEKAYKALSNTNRDCIIALGGGSVIDFSKALAIKLSYPEKDLLTVNPFEKISLKLKLVAIPTTSGTGSDVSLGIVLTLNTRKIALGNYDVIPIIDILDSSLTPTNKDIVRSTGIDALVHAFEAYSSKTSSIFTDAIAEKTIIEIFKNLPLALEGDESGRDNMHLLATMAGLAFSNSGTALAHALGHSFGGIFHVPHGTSVGIFLPFTIEINSRDERTKNKYNELAKMMGLSDVSVLLAKLNDFYNLVGQPRFVKDLKIPKSSYFEKIDMFVKNASQDSELYFNPYKVTDEDLKHIYTAAYGD